MFLYVWHVAYVGSGWDYAETWMAFSELLRGSDCYNPMGFTDLQSYGTGSSLPDCCVICLLLCDISALEFIQV